ncbi:MAG: hypothetical protein NVSMB6_10470 [Burkholderiaceae bacterium]
MDLQQRIATKLFVAEWREALKDIRDAFVNREGVLQLSSKREKNGSLWTLIEKPYPGVRLLAIHMETTVPLKIYLKVWVDQSGTALYERLSSASPPQIRGRETVVFRDQNPPKSWMASLKAEGLIVRGLRYNVDDVSFLNDKNSTITELRKVGEQFCRWFLESVNSKATDMGSEMAVPFLTHIASEKEATSLVTESPPDSDHADSIEVLVTVEGTAEAVDSVKNDSRFTNVEAKTRLALVNARIGQGGYRKRMLSLWGHRCALTGCDIETVLIASHAMPWRECSIEDCLNEYNGLLLVASLDRLFDAGQISFSNEGVLLKHPALSWAQLEHLGLTKSSRLRPIHEQHWRFLAAHRAAHSFYQ